jgi:ParB family chromosome partitioning protein
MSVDNLVREYQEHTRQQRELVVRARTVHERLLILVTSMNRLLADEHFVTLLRAENMDTIPAVLIASAQ